MNKKLYLEVRQEDVSQIKNDLQDFLVEMVEGIPVHAFLSDCITQLKTSLNPSLTEGEAIHLRAEVEASNKFVNVYCQKLHLNSWGSVVIGVTGENKEVIIHSMEEWKSIKNYPISEMRGT